MFGFGYDGDDGKSVSALRDMFDGGGSGQSGPRFEGGGILSSAANTVFRPVGSRDRGEPDMRTGPMGFARDMVDGGGFNASGNRFEGGGLYGRLAGGLMNRAGIRPLGYAERQREALPGVLEAIMAGITPPQAPAGQPAPIPGLQPPPAVATTQLPNDFASMLARLQNDGINKQYGGRGSMGMPTQSMQYGGRGSVGMPVQGQVGRPYPESLRDMRTMRQNMLAASPFGGS